MIDLQALADRIQRGEIKALSIKQPYPHHIFHDGKDVENRDWATRGRGWIIVHAGVSKTEIDKNDDLEMAMPRGGVVGMARIVDCVEKMDSRWFFGRYGFVLKDAFPLPLHARVLRAAARCCCASRRRGTSHNDSSGNALNRGRTMSEIAKRALYFGCQDRPGHYLHEGTRSIWDPPPGCPWDLGLMDGGLLKNGKHEDIEDGRVWWTCGGRVDFWYAFFWWDNSVDRRGACNSGFYVLGFKPDPITPKAARENAALAFDHACAAYPWVIKRQRHVLTLQFGTPAPPSPIGGEQP